MALDAVDHFLLGQAQHQHERWAERNVFRTRELQQQLAEQAAANQGCREIIRRLVQAYDTNDWQTIQALLGDANQRMALYQSAYDQTYSNLNPT